MNNAEIVKALQRFQNLLLDTHYFRRGHRSAFKPVRQQLPVEQFQYKYERLPLLERRKSGTPADGLRVQAIELPATIGSGQLRFRFASECLDGNSSF